MILFSPVEIYMIFLIQKRKKLPFIYSLNVLKQKKNSSIGN